MSRPLIKPTNYLFMISLVMPVYNEENILEENINFLWRKCREIWPKDWQIIISDNNSTDKSGEIARRLTERHREIKYFFAGERGKGNAVINAWLNFPADIYIFMDADLSADLAALPELAGQIKKGYDLVIGSRYVKGSRIARPAARKIISYCLRQALNIFLRMRAKDAPCGFKAINPKTLREIVPLVANRKWFFDTEIVFWAEKKGLRVKEIAVNWEDKKNGSGRESRVSIARVSWEYLKNIKRLYACRKKN